MPGPSDHVPRWQPPPGFSDDVPRWQPPTSDSRPDTWQRGGGDVPRWDPATPVPRWQPRAGGPVGARIGTDEGNRRAPSVRVSPLALPFVWWRAHPWVPVWAAVSLAPVGVLLLRFADEYGADRLVEPLKWALIALLAVVLVRATVFSARRSLVRLVLGVGAAVGALAVLLWPMTQVTLGRAMCPSRAGADRGVQAAAAGIEAWQRGEPGEAAWRAGAADVAWREKARAISLLDYQLVDSGCFERVAPIDTNHTWHEFRVTVKEGERAPLSKIVVVRTAAAGSEWKITGIEGPLP